MKHDEHPAERHAVHDAAMYAETHDPPRPVVYHDEYPVRVEDGRFAPKQVHAPQTILRMPEDGQPRRPRGAWFGLVPSGENPSHHVSVDGNTEGERHLLRDPWTAPTRIPLFHLY